MDRSLLRVLADFPGSVKRRVAPTRAAAPVRYEATRELLAPRGDIWAFLAEPYHLADWWPTISGVRPDRRGLAPGARWEIVATAQATLLRRPRVHGLLIVRAVEPNERVAWHLPRDRLDVEVSLRPAGPDRTLATVAVD